MSLEMISIFGKLRKKPKVGGCFFFLNCALGSPSCLIDSNNRIIFLCAIVSSMCLMGRVP